MRWLLRAVIVVFVLVILGGAYFWYIGDGDPPAELPVFALDLDTLRDMSDDIAGDPPTEVRVEQIASFSFPAVAIKAGDGWNFETMGAFAYQIVFPSETVVLDSGLNAEQGSAFGATIDDDAYSRMEVALLGASQILVTHEHTDHLGGIISYAAPAAIAGALRLTPEQRANVQRYGMPMPAEFTQSVPLSYDTAIAIAPGVVLQKAPGHSPGSQIVFVRLANGRELLFIGDVAWAQRNVETGKGRPRLMSEVILQEDRDAVFAQLKTLKALRLAEPDLAIVPGHEISAIDDLVSKATLTARFRP